MDLVFDPDEKGILPDAMIHALAEAGAILPSQDFLPGQIQPASLDLRLGDVAYRVRASFLPGPNTTVADRIVTISSCMKFRSATARCWKPAASISCR